jgi:hypothetical protein
MEFPAGIFAKISAGKFLPGGIPRPRGPMEFLGPFGIPARWNSCMRNSNMINAFVTTFMNIV